MPCGPQHMQSALSTEPQDGRGKLPKAKLLPHEMALLHFGELKDVTHSGASAAWLAASSAQPQSAAHVMVYRPMGDKEMGYLREQGTLPATQPYQTIVEVYCYVPMFLPTSNWFLYFLT